MVKLVTYWVVELRPELILVLSNHPARDVVVNLVVDCRYFSLGLQLLSPLWTLSTFWLVPNYRLVTDHECEQLAQTCYTKVESDSHFSILWVRCSNHHSIVPWWNSVILPEFVRLSEIYAIKLYLSVSLYQEWKLHSIFRSISLLSACFPLSRAGCFL